MRASPRCSVRDAPSAERRTGFRRLAQRVVRGVRHPGAGIAGRPVGDLLPPDPRPTTRTRGQGARVAGAHRAAGSRVRFARRARLPRHQREQHGMVHAGGREPDAPPAATGCNPAVVAGRRRGRVLARGRDGQRLRWPARERACVPRRRRRDRVRLAFRRRLAGGDRAGAARHIDALTAGPRERPCDRGRARPRCANAFFARGGGARWAACLRGTRRLRCTPARGAARAPREPSTRHLRSGSRNGQPPRGSPGAPGGRRVCAMRCVRLPVLDARRGGGVGGRGRDPSEIRLTDFGWEAGPPDWSRDGTRLLFVSWERGGAAGVSYPYVVTIDTATGRAVGHGRLPLPPQIHNSLWAAWSPVSDDVALEEDLGGGRHALWIAASNGASARKVTEYPMETYGGVSWTPDGKALVYAALTGGRMQLFEIPAAGGTPQQLTHDSGNLLHPRVSPRGNLIAATRLVHRKEIWRVPLPH